MNLLRRRDTDCVDLKSAVPCRVFQSDEMPEAIRLELVRQFGDQSLSYSSAIQTGLQHFGDDNGFIAFGCQYGQIFALGDPITAAHRCPALITAFLKAFPRATFVQINENTAEILSGMKFWVNEIGHDTRLDLEHYDFRGKEKERFRYAANWLMRRDYTIVELPFENEVISQTRAICERWRKTRYVKRETAFVNRPLEFRDQPDTRRFFLLDDQAQIVAFVFFDPLYLSLIHI